VAVALTTEIVVADSVPYSAAFPHSTFLQAFAGVVGLELEKLASGAGDGGSLADLAAGS
jgi:hypothetical protein